jgi:hypothetical protein
VGFVIARHQHGRAANLLERVKRLGEPEAHRGEVAGAHHHVGLARALHQPPRLGAIAMEVAEGEQLHSGLDITRNNPE